MVKGVVSERVRVDGCSVYVYVYIYMYIYISFILEEMIVEEMGVDNKIGYKRGEDEK